LFRVFGADDAALPGICEFFVICQSINQSISLYCSIVQRRMLQCGYAESKINVLRRILNVLTDGAVRQFSGREFQSLGAATEKRRAAVSEIPFQKQGIFYRGTDSECMVRYLHIKEASERRNLCAYRFPVEYEVAPVLCHWFPRRCQSTIKHCGLT